MGMQNLDAIRRVLEEDYVQHPVSVIKDPRLCIMFPYWLKAAMELYSIENIFVVWPIRHPYLVAQSLSRAKSPSVEEGVEMWRFYNGTLMNWLAKMGSERWALVDVGAPEFPEGLIRIALMIQESLSIPFNGGKAITAYHPEDLRFKMAQLGSTALIDSMEYCVETYLKLAAMAKTGRQFKLQDLELEVAYEETRERRVRREEEGKGK